MENERKTHWEHIYTTKQAHEVSWTQDLPQISLKLITALGLDKHAAIIDIGAGDSKLVDYLLAEGYTNMTVLDISEAAIKRAQNRLGANASKVNWVVSDMLDFKPIQKYALWHDRAAFHFLTDKSQIQQYQELVKEAVAGYLVIGTFSVNGPQKCSGLPIQQYSEAQMQLCFEQASFEKLNCQQELHHTPSGTVQDFIFCTFQKTT